MSDSSTNEAKSDVTSGLSDATQNRILRFTIGVALATFLAAWIDWPLAFVAPIFTAKFLFEKRVLHIDIVYELLLAMIVTVAIGVALSVGFAQYPIPMLLSVAALMLVGYYLFLNPRWNLFATILLMSTLMLPFMAIQSTGTTIFLAVGLSLSGAISVGIFALMHVYLPEREETYQSHKAVELSDSFRWFSAVRALIMAFPVVCVFFVFQISEALLSMIFIALLSLMITGEKSVKLSVFLLISNAIGGVIAIIVFGFLALVPNIGFYTLFIALLAIFLGQKMYTESAKAPIYATALNTALVLIGTTLMSSGVIDEKMWIRLGLLALVAVYMVVAAFFIETRQWKVLQFKGQMMASK